MSLNTDVLGPFEGFKPLRVCTQNVLNPSTCLPRETSGSTAVNFCSTFALLWKIFGGSIGTVETNYSAKGNFILLFSQKGSQLID